MVLGTIQYLCQCIHEGSRVIWTESVENPQKWLETRNTDSNITPIFVNTLLYISGEGNALTQCTNLALHSDILCIGWPSIILVFIPKYLARTQQTYFTHIGSKITVIKWASQLIIKIWKLIYGQWFHHSKLKHLREALGDNTKELILDAKITDENGQDQDKSP